MSTGKVYGPDDFHPGGWVRVVRDYRHDILAVGEVLRVVHVITSSKPGQYSESSGLIVDRGLYDEKRAGKYYPWIWGFDWFEPVSAEEIRLIAVEREIAARQKERDDLLVKVHNIKDALGEKSAEQETEPSQPVDDFQDEDFGEED